MRERLDFAGAQQVALLRKTTRNIDTGKTTVENWYLITSVARALATGRFFLDTARRHWGIENKLHHVKDRTWLEDDQKTRQRGSGAVLALLRNAVVNGLRVGPGFRKGASLAEKSRHCLFQPMRAMRLAGIGR